MGRLHWICEQHGQTMACDDCGECLYCCQYKRAVTNEQLKAVLKSLPEDYEPWGQVAWYDAPPGAVPADCSCGCKWFVELAGNRSADYGVCANPASHRAGYLTHEHQGCPQFEYGDCEKEE